MISPLAVILIPGISLLISKLSKELTYLVPTANFTLRKVKQGHERITLLVKNEMYNASEHLQM